MAQDNTMHYMSVMMMMVVMMGILESILPKAAAPMLVSIAVTPVGPITMGLTNVLPTQQFTAIGTYSDKSTRDITSSVVWASDNIVAVTVSNGGLVTGLVAGTANISATLSGVAGDIVIITVQQYYQCPYDLTWHDSMPDLVAYITANFPGMPNFTNVNIGWN